jgi:multidrug efflux pump subunit AcrA (membrane-fusion protein)
MKRWTLLIVVAFTALALGWGLRDWSAQREAGAPAASRDARNAAGPCPGGAQPLHWKAPMDPSYVRDAPGKSPMGMDLVPVCPDDAGAGPGLRIDPALVQSIGVRTAPVVRRDLARRIRAVGRVDYDERRVDHVHTKFQGWIERLHVEYVGEIVERGQPLLEIYSPELVSTQEELLQAARYRETTSESAFEDVARGGDALFRATRRRLELFDIPEHEIQRLLDTGVVRKTLTLYAPTEGVVTHLAAREGMEVGPNDNLYTIADLSRVWVYADVYEYELPWVRKGQTAKVELSYLPEAALESEVTYVYPFLDPKTRTARVRLELPNPGFVLKPNMYANVIIDTQVLPGVVTVPDEAVLRSGRRSLAVVDLGEGRFESRELQLGLDSGDGWLEVREGLREGERVVTSGQFLIDSESRLREAVPRLSTQPPAEAPPRGAASDPGSAVPAPTVPDPHAGHVMPAPAVPRAPEGDPVHAAPVPDPHAGHAAPAGEH